jgi:cobalamin synthase
MVDARTVGGGVTDTLTERETRPRRRSVLRGASGAVAACLVLLLLTVLASQIFFQTQGYPGIGWLVVSGHALAAVIAVVLQRLADRRRGAVSALASLAVLTDAALTLWLYWWS